MPVNDNTLINKNTGMIIWTSNMPVCHEHGFRIYYQIHNQLENESYHRNEIKRNFHSTHGFNFSLKAK